MSSTEGGSSPRSSVSNSSSSARINRRLGYIKPETVPFSNSARNRSSVLALGRIDHLQHHFARAERLTGRNASPTQFKAIKAGRAARSDSGSPTRPMAISEEVGRKDEDDHEDSEEQYIHPMFVPLPPSPIRVEYVKSVSKEIDPLHLRKKLSRQILACCRHLSPLTENDRDSVNDVIHFADTVITCIRAARTYSTSIPLYQASKSSFSVFRDDALEVLFRLKQILERDGRGGLQEDETIAIKNWLINVREYMDSEDPKSRDSAMTWLDPSIWAESANEQRLCAFLKFYDPSSELLSSSSIDENLSQLNSGVRLCQIYNAIVERSRKPFGLITRFHEDTSIKYRVFENLKCFRAAIAYRFDVHLQSFSVQDIYEMTKTGRRELREAVVRFSYRAMEEMAWAMVEHTVAAEDGEREEEASDARDQLRHDVEALRVQETAS